MGAGASDFNFGDMSVHDIQVNDLKGQPLLLKEYRGKVLLIVNTASKCGYTPQLKGLEDLYELYKDKGFEVLGFPSNDFLGQEPLEGDAIQEFCTLNYGTKFPLFEKIHVKGKEQHPLYQYLCNAVPEHAGAISWNFNKFLISKNGKIITRFGTKIDPLDDQIKKAIDGALEEALVDPPEPKLPAFTQPPEETGEAPQEKGEAEQPPAEEEPKPAEE